MCCDCIPTPRASLQYLNRHQEPCDGANSVQSPVPAVNGEKHRTRMPSPFALLGRGPTSQLKIDTMSNNRPWTKEDVKSRILNTVCPETHLPPIPEHNLALPSGHACPAPAFRLHAHRCNTSTAIQSTATVRILCNPRGLQSTAKNKI